MAKKIQVPSYRQGLKDTNLKQTQDLPYLQVVKMLALNKLSTTSQRLHLFLKKVFELVLRKIV